MYAQQDGHSFETDPGNNCNAGDEENYLLVRRADKRSSKRRLSLAQTVKKLEQDGTSSTILHYTRAENYRVTHSQDVKKLVDIDAEYAYDVRSIAHNLGDGMKELRKSSGNTASGADEAGPSQSQLPAPPGNPQTTRQAFPLRHRRGLSLRGTGSVRSAANTMEQLWKTRRLQQATAGQLRDFLTDHSISVVGNKPLLLAKAAAKLQDLHGDGNFCSRMRLASSKPCS